MIDGSDIDQQVNTWKRNIDGKKNGNTGWLLSDWINAPKNGRFEIISYQS